MNAWHTTLHLKHGAFPSNAYGVDCFTFQTFASRHRWLEITDWMPKANAPDAEIDEIYPHLPHQNTAMFLCGTCGFPPDEALIHKEHDEGPVGTLGKLRKQPTFFDWLDDFVDEAKAKWRAVEAARARIKRELTLERLARIKSLPIEELVSLDGPITVPHVLLKAMKKEVAETIDLQAQDLLLERLRPDLAAKLKQKPE